MQKNVSDSERVLSGILGGLAILSALGRAKNGRRFRPARLLVGAVGSALLWRSGTGHCAVYEHYETNSNDVMNRIAEVGRHTTSVCINKSLDEVQSYLGGYGGEALAMQVIDNGHSFTCRIRGHEMELTPSDYGDGRRTILTAKVKITQPTPIRVLTAVIAPPAAGISTSILRNIKALMETGEIASVEGQPHGERTLVGTRIGKAVESAQNNANQAIQSERKEVRA